MIQIAAEVREAVDEGRPVVALESTVLAQGLPRPRNIEVGQAMEAAIREAGAVPATIAVIAGVPKVGLSGDELARIGTNEDVLKLSTRDIPVAVARRADGATTVAATMWLAARSGIEVFATGGIGGVHRGRPRDVSADLSELARTEVLVVCAGAKSVLELGETREALESAGVLVVGWKTAEMPGFYSRETGLPVDARVDDASEVADIWAARGKLGAPGAVLLCVPPPEAVALPVAEVEEAIAAALEEANRAGVTGKAVTPFLLASVARVTRGQSLETNVGLLLENARVAAGVAVAVAGR